MTPIGPQLAKAYAHQQEQMHKKHTGKWEQMELPFNQPLNKKKIKPAQFGSPEDKAKWDHEKAKLKKNREDLEALLKLDEELWNS